MIDLFLKYVWEFSKDNVSASVMLIVITLILTIWIAIKIDRTVNRSNSEQESLKEETAVNRKQISKLETLVGDLPCVCKETATWLQNVNKNGGSVPTKCQCKYLEDLEKSKNRHEG